MNNKIIHWLMIFAITVIIGACSEEEGPDADISVISVGQGKENDFDKYLDHILVKPYNIRFLYKFEDVESDLDYQLVPAVYENSIRMANLVKYLCLDAYEEVAPDNFLEAYFPKMLMMVGSGAYRNNGTYVLGTAEGGLKITLYDINSLDVTDVDQMYEYYFRTIYHEFSHILHQTKDYTTDFDRISATEYVGGSWNDAWKEDDDVDPNASRYRALNAGFISEYSSKEANEDFVELIAHYITSTPEFWDDLMNIAGSPDPDTGEDRAKGRVVIEEKLSIVKSYLDQSWDIDMDELRAVILKRGDELGDQDLDNITIKE